jgi:hypothetical protein
MRFLPSLQAPGAFLLGRLANNTQGSFVQHPLLPFEDREVEY